MFTNSPRRGAEFVSLERKLNKSRTPSLARGYSFYNFIKPGREMRVYDLEAIKLSRKRWNAGRSETRHHLSNERKRNGKARRFFDGLIDTPLFAGYARKGPPDEPLFSNDEFFLPAKVMRLRLRRPPARPPNPPPPLLPMLNILHKVVMFTALLQALFGSVDNVVSSPCAGFEVSSIHLMIEREGEDEFSLPSFLPLTCKI